MSEMHPPIPPKNTVAPNTSFEITDPLRLSAEARLSWLKRFFAANPFYLASVVLLLYGIHGVSAGRRLLETETQQLIFNFTSLQVYELLLIAAAIMLARLRVWYDSTLLIGLESAVLIVPFILVSQVTLLRSLLTIPAGLLAVVGSSVLLGVGTVTALTKHRWHQKGAE